MHYHSFATNYIDYSLLMQAQHTVIVPYSIIHLKSYAHTVMNSVIIKTSCKYSFEMPSISDHDNELFVVAISFVSNDF